MSVKEGREGQIADFARWGYVVALALLVYTSSPRPSIGVPSPSGQALAVVQSTSASGPGGKRVLAATKPVFSGDRITTGKSGEVQIRFEDNTRLVVGPNSSVLIDKFVFNPNQ